MKKNEELIGKELFHKKYGRVKVDSIVKGTRSFVVVVERDRGKGYNHEGKRYDGVKFKGGWSRSQNYCYGDKHEVNICSLN